MTFNGGVIITMICFSVVSYFIFGSKDGDADMPINCCANTGWFIHNMENIFIF